MTQAQAGICAQVPLLARHMFFSAIPGANLRAALRELTELVDGESSVIGLGRSLVWALGCEVPGLSVFPGFAGARIEPPSTPADLWCWLRGDDRGELVHRARRIEKAVSGAFRLRQGIDAFRYASGRDLTGYEDGTENPQGEAALEAAVVRGQGSGLDGASCVAVQQWLHDFDGFDAMSGEEQDNAIGRRRSDNEDLHHAPPSAHVKR
ncbi:MAG: Dyp-type peroxidase, partial [Sulfuritalea sp.]|nr:Dyp-type peroxidase [Sulfuritalea sp.]